ncbi:RodZ domain-containing protein [Onishia taeanensis]
MSDMHDNDTVDMARQASPGDILRGERENQGLTLDEVATSLNLRPAVVAGLEKDDYEEVPVVAYRRGYLRAYARLLGIDEAGVLDAYRAAHGATETERRVTPVKIAKPPSKLGAWLFKLVTLVVILGLAGLTLLWWQSRDGSGLPGLSDNEPVAVDTLDGTAVIEEPAAINESEMPPLPADGGDLGLTDSQADDQTDASGTDQNTAQGTAQGNSQTDGAAATEQPTGAADEASTDTAQADGAPAADSDTTAARDDGSDATADAGVLELTFNEQSWTEIFDANDERIFVGLQTAGSNARAEGVPPFRLTIGNASGVELRYRGEAVDLAEYAGNNNVARFSLGE